MEWNHDFGADLRRGGSGWIHDRALPVVVVVLCLWPSLARAQDGGPPPARVYTELVREEVVERWRRVTGELLAPQRTNLAAEEDGRVVELPIELGDTVDEGTMIAIQDTTLRKLERARLAGEVRTRSGIVAQRRAELAQAQRDLERFRQLRAQGSANESELDNAQTRVDILVAQLDQAESQVATAGAELDELDARIENMTILAPFAGRVVAKHTEVGQWLRPGDPVVEILSLDHVDALLDVPEGLVDRLRDRSVTIRVRVPAVEVVDPKRPDTREPFEIERPVTAIVPVVDQLSRLIPVRIRFENPGLRITPGMSVVGLVPTGTDEPQLTVSKDAILRDDAGEFVYADIGGTATPIRVRTRYAVDQRVVIEPGSLEPGMRVVAEGNERLFPGQPLEPIRESGEGRSN